ncbi:MAG: 16S rRNA (cytosine(1402)-N(4))-methyltransferase [Bacteroidia bacterium]
MQIDNPDRGFTFKHDGPLDLRLNPDEGMPASILLHTLSPGDLEDLLIDNSDEKSMQNRLHRPFVLHVPRAIHLKQQGN